MAGWALSNWGRAERVVLWNLHAECSCLDAIPIAYRSDRLLKHGERANDLAAYLGSLAAVSADSGNEPLEIEVTGGQPGAALTQEEMEALLTQSRANAQLGQ